MPRIRADSIAEHKRATRNAILDAATKVFLASGYSRSSLSAIADVAGIPRTTLYEYFSSKGHILLAALEERVPPLLDELLAGLEDGSPTEVIREMFRDAVAFAVKWPEVAALMFRVGRELPIDLRERMWVLLDPVKNELLCQCRRGAESGRFATSHPERTGQLLADVLVGAVDEIARDPSPGEAAPDVLEARLDFIVAGLEAAKSEC